MKEKRHSFRERWKETVAENEKLKEEELTKKEEASERLKFDGKFTKLFYKVMWKNFRRNLKDYLLLLICNALIFGCAVVALGMREILSQQYEEAGLQIMNGLGQIFFNAVIPIAVIAIIIFILLFFYYIKCRGRNFGVFLTLGMRRNLLYKFVALEYVTVLGMAIFIGGGIGAGILVWFVANSEKYLGVSIPLSTISIGTFGTAIIALLYLCVISLMFARSIFTDFNVGKSTDLRAIGEKLPMRIGKGMVIAGMMLCLISILRYRNLNNYENVSLLFVLFVGILLIIRYGMAEYLLQKRKRPAYLKKLLLHSQLYHKSKSSTAYIVTIFVVQFCVLFYFLFSVISIRIAEEPKDLYPYDVVCLADENDDEFLDELTEKYDLETTKFHALRVTTYDSTESKENGMKSPIQGQHIGISESTYHKLKKMVEPSYKAKNLDLSADGENVYIVYQQDKSIKAHPIGYFIPRDKPSLHIGKPCRLMDISSKQENGYDYYEVKGEEIGSLIGVFGQGMKENIIVFSDAYFEKAKDFWKTTDIITGEQLEEEERIQGFNIYQGMTRLVLMNVDETDSELYEEKMSALSGKMKEFEEKHIQEEDEVYSRPFLGRGLYDASISYHYMKTQEIKNLVAERMMKLTMNLIVMVVFFAMNYMLILIHILSEKELNEKRAEFLNCMGMCKKKRISFIRNELIRYYYLLPVGLATAAAILFSICTFHARMYTEEVVKVFLGKMLPLWAGYFITNSVIMLVIATIYAHKIEN